MAIVRSARRNVKIKHFYLNSQEEVIVKIVKEILTLFKIELDEVSQEPFAYESLTIDNQVVLDDIVRVNTKIRLVDSEQVEHDFCIEAVGQCDERKLASSRRLIKLNLYHLFRKYFPFEAAPWGILHGVRPTKIVHHYIDQGLTKPAIISRLQNDYEVSTAKAELITKLAFKQRSFLATSSPKLVSVYVGIPFCLSRCLYCSFPSYVLPKQEILDQFMVKLQQDIVAAKSLIIQHGLSVQSIYIGGGTPTSLPDEEFMALLNLVKDSFYGVETVEFTVEAGRPDTITDYKIAAMMNHSVNRVSVNPQTMQLKTLKRIGRNHTPEAIIEMFHKFRNAGMPHINMDLIIGLPGETCEDMTDTMQKIVALNPDDITLHALALKKGSQLKMNGGCQDLPNDETAQAMFAIAMDAVEKLKMEPYYLYRQGYMSGNLENVGCSKSGSEGFYNIQIMEEHQTIIGIGPAATTKVINPITERMQTSFNAKDLTTYLNHVDKYIEKRTILLNTAFSN